MIVGSFSHFLGSLVTRPPHCPIMDHCLIERDMNLFPFHRTIIKPEGHDVMKSFYSVDGTLIPTDRGDPLSSQARRAAFLQPAFLTDLDTVSYPFFGHSSEPECFHGEARGA